MNQVVKGQKVFMAHRHQCHSHDEAGVGPAINNMPLPAFMIRLQVRCGMGAMPGFSKQEVGDGDLDSIIACLKALRRGG